MRTSTSRRERGSALLIIFVFAAMIAIALYAELPVAVFETQRQKEQLLIDRGNEYARGVKLYVRKVGQYPASFEALENTNRMRFLRKRFKDPFTGKDDWRILHAGPGGTIIDSKVNPIKTTGDGTNASLGTATSNTPGNTGFASANPFSPAAGATSSVFASSSGSGGFNAGNSQTANGTQPNAGNTGFGGFNSGAANTSFGGYYSSVPTANANAAGGTSMPALRQRAAAIAANAAAGMGTASVVEANTGLPGAGNAGMPPPGLVPNGSDAVNAQGGPNIQLSVAGQPTGQTGMPPGMGNQGGAFGSPGVPTQGAGPATPGSFPGPGGMAPGNTAFGSFAPGSPAPGFPSPGSPAPGSPSLGSLSANGSSSSGLGSIQSGSIAGVASKAVGHSIKTVNDQENYSLWEFFYDPSKDATRNMAAATAQLGAGVNQSNPSGFNGQNRSGFGPQNGSGQNSPFGNSGSGFGGNSPFNNSQSSPFGNPNSGFGNSTNNGFGNSSNGFGNSNSGFGNSTNNGFGNTGGMPPPAIVRQQ